MTRSRRVALVFPLLCLAAAALAEERILQLPNGEALRYELIDPGSQRSARDSAYRLLRHLADGNIESAAALSNAPKRRLQVLQSFRESVGEEAFKRLFSRYFAPENRLVMEAAIGRHRLLVWELGEAGHQLAGQYWGEVAGNFVLDDVPSSERANLQRVLEAYRRERAPE
jgi:hypothetical protein